MLQHTLELTAFQQTTGQLHEKLYLMIKKILHRRHFLGRNVMTQRVEKEQITYYLHNDTVATSLDFIDHSSRSSLADINSFCTTYVVLSRALRNHFGLGCQTTPK